MIYLSLPTTLFFLSAANSYAQLIDEPKTGLSLGIYPTMTRVIIEPGRSTELVFKITNQGDPTVLHLSLVPFVPADESGGIKIVDCQKEKIILCQYLNWFSFKGTVDKEQKKMPVDQGSFFINRNQSQNIKLQLFVPKNITDGEYTFSLLLNSQPPRDLGTTHNKLSVTLGSNILVTVTTDGILRHQGRIVYFAPIGGINIKGLHLFDSFDDISLNLKIANTGQTTITTSGEITLSSPFLPKATFSLPKQYILPKTTRILNNNPTLHLKSSLLLGRYQATAKVHLTPEGTPISVTTVFWALPFKGIFVLIMALAVLLLTKRLKKNLRSKKSHSKK